MISPQHDTITPDAYRTKCDTATTSLPPKLSFQKAQPQTKITATDANPGNSSNALPTLSIPSPAAPPDLLCSTSRLKPNKNAMFLEICHEDPDFQGNKRELLNLKTSELLNPSTYQKVTGSILRRVPFAHLDRELKVVLWDKTVVIPQHVDAASN